MKENKNYIDPQEFYDQYKVSKANNMCTERLGVLFITLTDHILRSPNFNRYPTQVKEDLKSHALLKLVKSLDTVKLNFSPAQIFNFATRTVYTAFLSELGRHYKYAGIKRVATRKYLENSPFIDARIRDQMISEIDEFENEIEMKKKATKERKIKKANS